jgi:hypothetical protein
MKNNPNRNQDLQNLGGGTLLFIYHNSMCELLQSLHPEHKWQRWRFPFCPISFWLDKKNQREFLEWVGKELKINEFDQWYGLTPEVIFLEISRNLFFPENSTVGRKQFVEIV